MLNASGRWLFSFLHLEARMATKDSKAEKPADKPDPLPDPLPVDVISSVPLSVQIAPESLASLGAPPAGTAEPVTVATATASPLGAGTGATTTTTTTTAPVPTTVTKGEGTTLSPTTTEAEDTTTEGQRKVNLIWELTQAGISVLITGAVVYCAVYRIPSDNLANAFFLIIGFYFSRTNHQAIGGIGAKPSSPYIDRVF